MREAWRWFGPQDPVGLSHIRHTGATDVVSALHDIPIGEVWPRDAVQQHRALIEHTPPGLAPLRWSVVESIPVHEAIKLGLPEAQEHIDRWILSMENLAKEGIKTICYNFMPVIDWTRTHLRLPLPSGAYALSFDQHEFAAFDLHILQRVNAEQDYSAADLARAKQTFDAMSPQARDSLTRNIIAGLPGKMTDGYELKEFRAAVARYSNVSRQQYQSHLLSFLRQVLPRAEALGVRLAIHPDDPPWALLGLPRVVCTEADLEELFHQLPSQANGMTLCVGTYGSRADNDLPHMAKRFGERVHFAHLRGVKRNAEEPRSFVEAEHLESDVDMVAVIQALLEEETRRSATPESEIFIRPDHGHQMMGDIDKVTNPGYSGIGRLKGLAEVRGVIRTLSHLSKARKDSAR